MLLRFLRQFIKFNFVPAPLICENDPHWSRFPILPLLIVDLYQIVSRSDKPFDPYRVTDMTYDFILSPGSD